ncbi:MAG: glycosyltransferase family 2 protein [Pyrinomonadaceae bacterium]
MKTINYSAINKISPASVGIEKSEDIGHRENGEAIELSVVIPCLNEADTIGICVEKAQRAIRDNQIEGEIIVADNGSTDGSIEIAEKLGAKVINIRKKGYGNALMGGIEEARGKFIIMGDADDSYDFLEIPKFVEKLREGHDLVQGCRLPKGGGQVKAGAMPFLHRWWGNPMFSLLAKIWFRSPINDIYCGLRGFTKEHYESLNQRCTGMEFATEMIIKSSVYKADIAEVPITLHPDGRKVRSPHLRTFRDGWRTLRFFLFYSPRWLFFVPGFSLILLGLLCYVLAFPRLNIEGVTFGMHTLLFGNLFIICGYQAVLFYLLTQTFAINEKMYPKNKTLDRFYRMVRLERGLFISTGIFVGGLILLGMAVNEWIRLDFGDILNFRYTMRLVIPGILFTSLGFESIIFTFFASILRVQRK